MLHIRKIPSRRELKALEAVRKPHEKPFDSDALRILAFSDYRVQDFTLLMDFVKTLKPLPNLIVYAGDDVDRFHVGAINYFEQLAAFSTHGLCAVLGNDPPPPTNKDKDIQLIPDTMILRSYIRGANVHNVHETPLLLGKYAVIGSEGAPPDEQFGDIGVVIYPEPSIERHLQLALKAVKGKSTIVVSHCPPRGVLDRAIRFGTRHIGSTALRKMLFSHKNIPLVVCGHVHSCGARAKKYKRSMVVNAASHDNFGAPGRIAIINISAGKVKDVQWHQLWELGSICGIKEGRAARLRTVGIRNVTQLAETAVEKIQQILKCGMGEALSIKARASAILKQDVVIANKMNIPRTNRAYIDIETDSKSKFIWLVGIHVEEEGRTYSFFAQSPAREKKILAELSEFLAGRQELQLLSYSNSAVEQRLLPQRLLANGLPARAVESIQDIYYAIHASAAFPIESTTLKDVSRWCGFNARHPDLDGWTVALSYGSGKPSNKLKRLLIAYNEDDLLALKHVVGYIENHPGVPAADAAGRDQQMLITTFPQNL